MPHKCPFCEQLTMTKLIHPDNKKHFLCEIDTSITPASIDPSTGIPVDLFGCAKCGTIILNNPAIIQ